MTLSSIYSIANVTGHTNLNVSIADIPLTNITGMIPGPLHVHITAPNTSAVDARAAEPSSSRQASTLASPRRPRPKTSPRKERPCRGSAPASQQRRLTRAVAAAIARLALGRAWSAPRCSARFSRALRHFFWPERTMQYAPRAKGVGSLVRPAFSLANLWLSYRTWDFLL
ncbi:hypothetical protein EDB85DRAFT_1964486 [Lactarius pseudohatsudake]|nr:hypothetical protein EDB85DRAFT_1964486 [Lactarius pseudohatsudake]